MLVEEEKEEKLTPPHWLLLLPLSSRVLVGRVSSGRCSFIFSCTEDAPLPSCVPFMVIWGAGQSGAQHVAGLAALAYSRKMCVAGYFPLHNVEGVVAPCIMWR